MTKLRQHFPLTSKAYRLFVDELGGHLRAVHEVVDSEDLELEQEVVSTAGECCHKIKGGAGMFGLDQLAEVATQLEAAMLKPLDTLQSDLQEVKELLAELERQAEVLPEPEEQ